MCIGQAIFKFPTNGLGISFLPELTLWVLDIMNLNSAFHVQAIQALDIYSRALKLSGKREKLLNLNLVNLSLNKYEKVLNYYLQ
jgi:hypothetical protein